MMEKLRNDVISAVRACLVSTKGKMQIRQLDKDYQTLVGERIPYSKLGFQKLEDFLQSEETLMVTRVNGETLVGARIVEASAHISEMVYKQKTDKKKVLRKAVRFMPSTRPVRTSKWRPSDVNPRNKFHTSSRPAAVSHNQFVSRPTYNRPSVPSKVVVPESSSFHGKAQLQRQNSQPSRQDISTRLHVSKPALQERNVLNNGRTVVVENNVSEKGVEKSCSSLASTRKRITQKMSELKIDRDSGNSSPTDEVPVIANEEKLTEFSRTGDAIADLKNFVYHYKVGELDVSSKLVKTKQNRLFTCKIKIGKHIYTSYPKEFSNPLEAEKHCAEEALNDLIPRYGHRKSLLLASFADILERIPPMLEKHHHGIWGWQLQLDYADKYKEQLPADWLKVIDSNPCIQVEKCLDNYVLQPCKPGDKGQKWNTFKTLSDVSVPANTVQFGDDGKLFAEITCIMSANEIWCRQYTMDESDVFNEMYVKMEAFYNANSHELKAEVITEAGYYVMKYDDMWYRVRAIAVFDTEVRCFLIDYGDEMAIPKTNIYQLKREFALSQAQAFVCRLVGLEQLYETSSNSEMLQQHLYSLVILEMATDHVSAEDNSSDLSIPVFMYDITSGDSINEKLIPVLTMESASPTIKKESINEVFVSNIESNGDVYVQIHSHGYNFLQTLLSNLESEVLSNPPTHLIEAPTRLKSEGKLYFARYKVDSHWYRIQIIDWSPKGDLAQIYFVDYGNADVINVKEDILYPLEKLSDVISQYPFQALKVRMAIDNIPEDFVALASKDMPEDQSILLKIIEYDNQEVPWVEFFKRSADGGLFCINKSIMMNVEIKKGDGNNNLNSARRKLTQFDGAGKNVPSGGTLQRPKLPDKGKYFEVFVPFAVNPYNFFVQPLESRPSLNNMMKELQERYKDTTYSPLQVDQIVPGSIYASKNDDGNWYRTSVIKVIHSGSISVFYCDFGYYANLTVQQLVPLDVEFMEMPYQAVKAKLSDIKPKQSKWTMEDCEDFKSLVEKRPFYSVLLDIEKDELYESDIVLKLMLIDTSSEQDIYIGKELIKKGVAVVAV